MTPTPDDKATLRQLLERLRSYKKFHEDRKLVKSVVPIYHDEATILVPLIERLLKEEA